jgi:hypothetical protein
MMMMMMMMMMMIFAQLSSLPNALVSAQRRHRKSSTRARKGRTHATTSFPRLTSEKMSFTEKKRKERERERERERDACVVCVSDF